MESNTNNTPQNSADQEVNDGGLMVLVTDSFGTIGGDDDTPSDPTAED